MAEGPPDAEPSIWSYEFPRQFRLMLNDGDPIEAAGPAGAHSGRILSVPSNITAVSTAVEDLRIENHRLAGAQAEEVIERQRREAADDTVLARLI